MSNVVCSPPAVRIAPETQEDHDETTYFRNARAHAKAVHASRVRHSKPNQIRKNAITRQPHPATGDPDYTLSDTDFLMALDAYCVRVGRRFLQASEYKSILESLGYVCLPPGFSIVPDGRSGAEAA